MNTLFLHVGPHKTGTTAIQKFLLDNQSELFKSNLVYPQRYMKIFGHHGFRDLLHKQALSQDDLAFFQEKHDFLLSSEDFISLAKDKFEYLRYKVENKKIVVIFSWRRASFKLYSIWQETVKHGGTESFYSYYHNHLARPAQSQMLSADLKLNMFTHVFGKDNVKVLDYDASSQTDTLLADFLNICGIAWSDKVVTSDNNPQAINRSMDVTDIEIIRALNLIFQRYHSLQGSWVRENYIKQRDKLEVGGLSRLKEIVSQYKNELIVGNYFIDHRCEKIMVEKFSDNIVNYQPNTLTKKLLLAKDDWIFEPEAQLILSDLAKLLKETTA
jgi:hypothetical protein